MDTQKFSELMDLTVAVPTLDGILERFGGQGALTTVEQHVLNYARGILQSKRLLLTSELGIVGSLEETSAPVTPQAEEPGEPGWG